MTNLLGLAKKANKLIKGTPVVLDKLRKNQVYLIILANDASLNTKKQIQSKSDHYGCPTMMIDGIKLNQAIGQTNVKVIGITDQGFANSIIKKGSWFYVRKKTI